MSPARPLRSAAGGALAGKTAVPGDKSISHRALMISALAQGDSFIEGLLEGEDVMRTAAAVRNLGAVVDQVSPGLWRVSGPGIGGLAEPAEVLDVGNSGTAARLLMGLTASHPITAFFSGDASLNRRPMARVITPLERMGATFVARSGGRLPLAIMGTDQTTPITYAPAEPSAQVKSAILLAGLNTNGTTTVVEAHATRDHTELMLRHFGARVVTETLPNGAHAASVTGYAELSGRKVRVPGDPSSAAFPVVAALIRPGSEVTLTGVGINPHRIGLYETLREMGADIAFANQRQDAGEPVADIIVRHSALRGVTVPPSRAPAMIDEYPILAVAAAFAEGTTRMDGVGELRVKESDRLSMIAKGLRTCGVAVESGPDSLVVRGGPTPAGGATVATAMDHRIAMSFLVLGLGAAEPVTVDDGRYIDTSFPGFVTLMNQLGAAIEPA